MKLGETNLVAYSKYARLAIYGAKIEPGLAVEVIRRTDASFMNQRGLSPYQRAVKRLLGVPLEDQYRVESADGENSLDRNAMLQDLQEFTDRWGCVKSPMDEDGYTPYPLRFLSNSLIFCGEGWCYPDGTIAACEEVKRAYPNLIWDECEAVAATFPELEFSAAYWGGDSPEPSACFIVKDGYAKGTNSTDPDLFGKFNGLDHSNILKTIGYAEKAARDKLPHGSKFGDRQFDRLYGWEQPVRGLPDDIIEGWISKAQSLGLVSSRQQ